MIANVNVPIAKCIVYCPPINHLIFHQIIFLLDEIVKINYFPPNISILPRNRCRTNQLRRIHKVCNSDWPFKNSGFNFKNLKIKMNSDKALHCSGKLEARDRVQSAEWLFPHSHLQQGQVPGQGCSTRGMDFRFAINKTFANKQHTFRSRVPWDWDNRRGWLLQRIEFWIVRFSREGQSAEQRECAHHIGTLPGWREQIGCQNRHWWRREIHIHGATRWLFFSLTKSFIPTKASTKYRPQVALPSAWTREVLVLRSQTRQSGLNRTFELLAKIWKFEWMTRRESHWRMRLSSWHPTRKLRFFQYNLDILIL